MNDSASPESDHLSHPDKYSDPRVRIGPGQLLMWGLALTLVAAAAAALSVYARRTSLGQTTAFFGPDTITALQLADRVELVIGPPNDLQTVDLTATPGLGHLRRAILDDRHYVWETETETEGGVAGLADQPDSNVVTLRLADPVGKRVPVTELALELSQGWIGPADGDKRVRFNERVRPAIRHQIRMMAGSSQQNYDQRSK